MFVNVQRRGCKHVNQFQSNQSCLYAINVLMFYFNKSCVYAKLNILLLLSCIDLTTVGWNYITSVFKK